MTPAELEQNLKAGIDAVKRGQKQAGRDLLLKVVSANELSEEGWFWLSIAVDDPADKITALENVLLINPANRNAQANLTWLRGRPTSASPGSGAPTPTPAPPAPAATASGRGAASPPSPSPSSYAPESTPEQVEAIDDPHQCVYCGAPARQELRRCPECKRSLTIKRTRNKSISYTLNTAIYMIGIQIGLGIAESVVVASILSEGRNSFVFYIFDSLKLDRLFGNYLTWPPAWAPILLWASVARVAVFMLLLIGLRVRFSPTYYAAIGAMLADIGWAVFEAIRSFIGPVAALVNILLALASLAFIFGSDRDFEVNDERMLCAPDRRVKGGIELNRRGHGYSRDGRRALAVAHYRAAVAAMPNRAEFYKDLAIGYAQIGYYERALSALAEAKRQSPIETDLDPLQAAIEQKRSADPRPRG